MIHYETTAQERTQIDHRWHNVRGTLCNTGDGHYRGVNPADFKRADGADRDPIVAVDCPACCARQNLVAARERNLVRWAAHS